MMRARIALAALAVVGLTLVGPAPAFAQEESEAAEGEIADLLHEITGEDLTEAEIEEIQGGLSEEEFHCLLEQVEQVEHREAVTTCEEAPNPILPEINEVIWAVISFAVLFGLLAKFAFPAIRKGLEGREQAIRDDLEGAEQTRREAEQTLDEYKRQLAEARNEAARIIEEARQAADSMRREAQDSAEADAAQTRERAQAEIDQHVSRARTDLQREMGDFAVRLAERIVDQNLDRQAQQALIDQYIAEVGAGSNGGAGGGGSSGH